MSLTNCRFYEEKFPEIDSFVMVNVKQVRQTTLERLNWTRRNELLGTGVILKDAMGGQHIF
ncbi:Eukaryotic translation initiation factor 2 subunit alpha [Beauveria bassiana]|uniref:Eukaryotic translation initiation factor 2 subunit alpha n=1 Tax=Beauveria bassiana TaxID=176275 RepID=A0A2N6NBS7_BEABA|nr:Eukaryotic translation initiation factor 2 subunit alpha [Beauveria bassiana]